MPSTSSYPGSIDSFENPPTTLGGPPTHEDVHRHIADACYKIETELGTSPSGTSATVAARLASMSSTLTAINHVPAQIATPNVVSSGGQTFAFSSGSARYSRVGEIGIYEADVTVNMTSLNRTDNSIMRISLPTGWTCYGGAVYTGVGRFRYGTSTAWYQLALEALGDRIDLFRVDSSTSDVIVGSLTPAVAAWDGVEGRFRFSITVGLVP